MECINMSIEGKSSIVSASLFEENDLLSFIADNSTLDNVNFLYKKGYLGFLTNMARKIEEDKK